MIAVDASVLIDLLLGEGSTAGDAIARYLRSGEVVCAPHLVDAEVGQALRRFVLRGDLSSAEGVSMVLDFLDVPIKRYPHGPILSRAFEFRANVTVYDGLYLALAEALECQLWTGDRALLKVPGCRAAVQVLATQA